MPREISLCTLKNARKTQKQPYKKSGSDDWWVNISDQDGHRRSITLADQGIVPYSGGTWNTDNRPVKWYKKEDMKQ